MPGVGRPRARRNRLGFEYMALTKLFQPKKHTNTTDGNSTGDEPGAQVHVIGSVPAAEPFPDFDRAIDDSMWLLMYASETGRAVDDTTRNSILHAKAAGSSGMDETVAANLLVALTKLAAQLHPVTADTLRASGSQTKPTIKSLRLWTCVLAVPIVLFSVLGFVSSSIAGVIRADIDTANELVVKLRSELGTPEAPTTGTRTLNGDVITQLQQYASTIRAIDARARELNWFVFKAEWDPFAEIRWNPKLSLDVNQNNQRKFKEKFELPVGLDNMETDLDKLTATYQDVRSFAQDILDLATVSYGAITTCLLPVLYALLGTCAYLLRCFEEELRTVTFMPSSRANWARFLIAGIGGAVVGLFGNFNITQGASISPLAIAFLVGYAVDVFFSFLEGSLQAFSKRKSLAG